MELRGTKEEEKKWDLSRIWSWSIIVDILILSSSGRVSRSASMLLSILDPIYLTLRVSQVFQLPNTTKFLLGFMNKLFSVALIHYYFYSNKPRRRLVDFSLSLFVNMWSLFWAWFVSQIHHSYESLCLARMMVGLLILSTNNLLIISVQKNFKCFSQRIFYFIFQVNYILNHMS